MRRLRTEELSEREFLARLFENPVDDGVPETGQIHEQLVLRAKQFFEQRVVELSARSTTEAVYAMHERSGGEADATLLVRTTIAQAIKQAQRETAAAIREGRV